MSELRSCGKCSLQKAERGGVGRFQLACSLTLAISEGKDRKVRMGRGIFVLCKAPLCFPKRDL